MKTATGLVIALLLPAFVMGRQPQAASQPAQQPTNQVRIQALQEEIKALQLQEQIEKLQAEQKALPQQSQAVPVPQIPKPPAAGQQAPENCDGALADMHAKAHMGFHVPAKMQKQLDKVAAQLSNKTGVDMDSHAPAQALKDAQNKHACPPPAKQAAPGAPASAAKGGN